MGSCSINSIMVAIIIVVCVAIILFIVFSRKNPNEKFNVTRAFNTFPTQFRATLAKTFKDDVTRVQYTIGTLFKSPLSFTQIINSYKMYMTHYDFFDVPDGDLPSNYLLFNQHGIDTSLITLQPLGVRHFIKKQGNSYTGSELFKKMPYILKPKSIPNVPIPDQAVQGLQKLISTLTFGLKTIGKNDIVPVMAAIGDYTPRDKIINSKIIGSYFEVTRKFHWHVNIVVGFAYPPMKIGIMSGFVKNHEAADYLNIKVPPTVDPNALLAYDWGADITMSTSTRYSRITANEPAPYAYPFDSDKIDLVGKPIDNNGNYTIVGAITKPNFIKSPTATVPEILKVLFGNYILNDCELAMMESGKLIYI